jgi:dUTP pyrophosphatase
MRIRYKMDTPTATIPFRNGKAAGYDLYADATLSVQPGQTMKCPIGVAFEVPDGYEGQIRGRSGNSLRGFKVDLGTIDSDFREAVSAILFNSSRELWRVKAGERVAQIVFVRVEQLDDSPSPEIYRRERGPGFGSSGSGRITGNGG